VNISHRNEIGNLLNEIDLLGDGAEIGVAEGKFSEIILSTWKRESLFLIDPLKVLDDYEEADSNTEERNRACRKAVTELLEKDERAIWVDLTSEMVFFMFLVSYFDFVYVGVNHEYKHAKFDIANWYSLVNFGGLLCGHDYYNYFNPPNRNCRVKDAVDEFLIENPRLKLHHTPSCSSWWIQKPKL